MTSTPPDSWTSEENEARLLASLKTDCEERGFTFDAHPATSELPSFMAGYRPDAVARKTGLNIAFAIRRPASQVSLFGIRKLFVGQPEWRLDIIHAGGDPDRMVAFPRALSAAVRDRLGEVEALSLEGHYRAAFLLAWALLEAAWHTIGDEIVVHPLTAGAVVQSLALAGRIGLESERALWDLNDLRNRIVHGDLSIDVSAGDVEAVLSAAGEALTAEAA